MGSIAERKLGKRTVFYLRNESMVGRITRQKLQTLASVLGVAGDVYIDLEDLKDPDARFKYVIATTIQWCAAITTTVNLYLSVLHCTLWCTVHNFCSLG